jgi:hypothetical protein
MGYLPEATIYYEIQLPTAETTNYSVETALPASFSAVFPRNQAISGVGRDARRGES